MAAAIYARKNTDQSGISDEALRGASGRARAGTRFATAGVCSTSTSTLTMGTAVPSSRTVPAFLRLMNALKPRAPFQVLIMSEESRLGREAIETAYALKQLVQAGVRVFFYLEDRERRSRLHASGWGPLAAANSG
jgi:DNA invertase Pin-like site-specific DNA recombinase